MNVVAANLLLWVFAISIGQYGPNSSYIFVQSYHSVCDINRIRHSFDAKAHLQTPLVSIHCSKSDHSFYVPQYSMSSTSNNDILSAVDQITQHKTTRDTNTGDSNINSNVIITQGDDLGESFIDLPALEVIEFEGILNFRSALPGTGLPIYRCAALDNATASDSKRLLTGGLLSRSLTSTTPSTLNEFRCS